MTNIQRVRREHQAAKTTTLRSVHPAAKNSSSGMIPLTFFPTDMIVEEIGEASKFWRSCAGKKL
jgi:hypothetical protein